MNARISGTVLLAQAMAVLVLGGCGQSPSTQRLVTVAKWRWAICDGQGAARPLFSDKDYFTLFAEALHDPEEIVRVMAAMDLQAHSHFSGSAHSLVVDAYIKGGRDDQLARDLLKAWKASEGVPGTRYRTLDRGAPTTGDVRVMGQATFPLVLHRAGPSGGLRGVRSPSGQRA